MSRPRIRSLKPECWQDEALGQVSRDARLLFIGLITQADDQGRLRAALALLRSQIYPYDFELPLDEIDGWLAELEAVALVVRYEAADRFYVWLPGWKNQKVDHAKKSELPSPPRKVSARSVAKDRESSRRLANPLSRSGSDLDQDLTEEANASSSSENGKREDVDRLCSLLAELVVKNGRPEKMVNPRAAGWRDAARLLLDSDGRPLAEAERLIRWSQADEFWRSNILSMPKFREQYDKLRLRALANGGLKGPVSLAPPPDRSDDRLREARQ